MVQKSMVDPGRSTHLIIWCVGIACAILAVIVILAGITIFIIYSLTKPKVPFIAVRNAHLDEFAYNQEGLLITQLTVFINYENDNSRASANFFDATLNLRLGGKDIALLVLPPLNLVKNTTFERQYSVVSSSIPLRPVLRNLVDLMIKRDRITFDLEGDLKARWRIGFFGSSKFLLDVNCPIHFRFSTKESIGSQCFSKLK